MSMKFRGGAMFVGRGGGQRRFEEGEEKAATTPARDNDSHTRTDGDGLRREEKNLFANLDMANLHASTCSERECGSRAKTFIVAPIVTNDPRFLSAG